MGKGMDNNGFRSESTLGNRNNQTRQEVGSKILGLISREQKEKKEAIEAENRRNTQGNGKYINNGSNDRVNGKIYDGDNTELYPTPDDERSYFYGYVVHGGRRLYAVVEALEKENKIEEIMAIGKRDFEHGIEEDRLGMLAQNEHYMEGYNAAKAKRSR